MTTLGPCVFVLAMTLAAMYRVAKFLLHWPADYGGHISWSCSVGPFLVLRQVSVRECPGIPAVVNDCVTGFISDYMSFDRASVLFAGHWW